MTLKELKRTTSALSKEICSVRAHLIHVDQTEPGMKEALNGLINIFRYTDNIHDFILEQEQKEDMW